MCCAAKKKAQNVRHICVDQMHRVLPPKSRLEGLTILMKQTVITICLSDVEKKNMQHMSTNFLALYSFVHR